MQMVEMGTSQKDHITSAENGVARFLYFKPGPSGVQISYCLHTLRSSNKERGTGNGVTLQHLCLHHQTTSVYSTSKNVGPARPTTGHAHALHNATTMAHMQRRPVPLR